MTAQEREPGNPLCSTPTLPTTPLVGETPEASALGTRGVHALGVGQKPERVLERVCVAGLAASRQAVYKDCNSWRSMGSLISSIA